MLPEKTWKTEAILRFFLSVVVCFFAGSFTIAAVQFASSGVTKGRFQFFLLFGLAQVFLLLTLVLLRRGWRIDDSLMKVLAILGCFYAGLTLGSLAARMAGVIRPSVVQMIISALSLQGAVLVLLFPFLRDQSSSLVEGFGLRERPALAILSGLAIGAIFLPIGWILQAASAQLLTHLHVKPEQQQVVQTLQMSNASVGRAIFGLISIVMVPPAEEGFFRGILYSWVKRSGYPNMALWGTSILFAAIHSNLMSFIPLAVFAIALAMLYDKTGNLLAPISAHALFNAANLARLYYIEHAMR